MKIVPPPNNPVNLELVAALKRLLERAESGHVQGMCFAGYTIDDQISTAMNMGEVSPFLMLAAVAYLKRRVEQTIPLPGE